MSRYRFFSAADRRLDEIWTYTYEQWGEAQAKKYIQGLHRHIQKLANREIPWRRLPHSLLGLPDLAIEIFFSKYQKHYIFFRELPSGIIGVMSLLHVSMQIPIRLGEDLQKLDSKKDSE